MSEGRNARRKESERNEVSERKRENEGGMEAGRECVLIKYVHAENAPGIR